MKHFAPTPALSVALLLASSLACCGEIVSTHGSILQPDQVAQIKPGFTTQDQVRQWLGSPATTGALNQNRWVYVTSTMKDKPLEPNILTHRQVLVIDFDPSGTVVAVNQKTESDSKQIDPSAKITPTHGQSLGILDQIFQNIGVDKSNSN
jgi:outer membrane protein assembly factor BamE (lipoprotein component of BamABCDE complex)